jgi:hypothetical protein
LDHKVEHVLSEVKRISEGKLRVAMESGDGAITNLIRDSRSTKRRVGGVVSDVEMLPCSLREVNVHTSVPCYLFLTLPSDSTLSWIITISDPPSQVALETNEAVKRFKQATEEMVVAEFKNAGLEDATTRKAYVIKEVKRRIHTAWLLVALARPPSHSPDLYGWVHMRMPRCGPYGWAHTGADADTTDDVTAIAAPAAAATAAAPDGHTTAATAPATASSSHTALPSAAAAFGDRVSAAKHAGAAQAEREALRGASMYSSGIEDPEMRRLAEDLFELRPTRTKRPLEIKIPLLSNLPPAFAPCDGFEGAREGCVFKLGEAGLGYYSDEIEVFKMIVATSSGDYSTKLRQPSTKTVIGEAGLACSLLPTPSHEKATVTMVHLPDNDALSHGIQLHNDGLTIKSVLSGGHAEGKLQVHDRLIAFDGEAVARAAGSNLRAKSLSEVVTAEEMHVVEVHRGMPPPAEAVKPSGLFVSSAQALMERRMAMAVDDAKVTVSDMYVSEG